MARKKVNLQYIASDATRRATLKKRRANLMKKASELATLCDVDACVVVYGEGESQPEVWPAPATGQAARVLGRFQAMPETAKGKHMMDMQGSLRKRVDKLKEQLERARRDSHARETALLLHDAIAGRRPVLAGLSAEEIGSLDSMVKARLQEVTNALQQRLRGQGHGDPAAALQLSLASPLPQQLVPYTAGTSNTEVYEPQPLSWFLDDVAKAGGSGGQGGSFGGDVAGASTSGGGLGDMLQLGFGNYMAGLP